jgi:hypothetical protein
MLATIGFFFIIGWWALVRRQLWTDVNSPPAHQTPPLGNPSALMLELLIETACYAA